MLALIKRTGLFVLLSACGFCVVHAAESEDSAIWKKVPIPEQVEAFEGYANIPDIKLWYWDTGGEGETIVLLHPWSQSSLIWPYQQPVFAKAGYRVIAPSRRGSYKSIPGPDSNPGTAAGDLLALVDSLGLQKFHLVGCAAGGVTATAFAINNPDRLHSLTLCNSIVNPDEEDWRTSYARLQLAPLGTDVGLPPPEWRELGANYRFGNPEGTEAWAELEKIGRPNGLYNGQAWGAEVTWETIGRMNVPVLLMTGDSDLFGAPAMQRLFAQKFPNAETYVVREAGHAAYWEQPEEFNRVVLDWIGRHKP